MLGPEQGSTAAFLALAGAVSLAAAWALRGRVVAEDARAAALALRFFWGGLAGAIVNQLAMLLLVSVGIAGPVVALTTIIVANVASLIALGALVAYFAYLFTGSRKAVPVVVAVYAVVLALGIWTAVRTQPSGLVPTRWFVEPVATHQPTDLAAILPALAAFLPAIGGAIAFVVVGLRSEGPSRARGILVGAALTIWFVTNLAMNAPGARESDLAQLALRVASTVGLAGVILAYHPPRALEGRWGLIRLGEEHAYEPQQQTRARQGRVRNEALASRVRDLV